MSLLIIADSSALFSLIVATDRNHTTANKVSIDLLRQDGALLIPSDVFSEVVNILGKKIHKDHAMKAGRLFMQSDVFTLVEITSAIRSSALNLYEKQSASVSFTDCLVMACADEYKTKLIFGFDSAFRKNGYTRLGIDDQG